MNNNVTFIIARYERLENNNYVVAFNVKDSYENSTYIESVLTSDEVSGKTQNEICNAAYLKIKDKIDAIKLDFEKKNQFIVGSEFIPD